MNIIRKVLLSLFFICCLSPNVISSEVPVDYNITSFSAKGNGKTINTAAINKAIETCSVNGGGRIIVPKGVFMTGSIILKSNIHLYLEKGAILKGITDLKNYVSISDFNTEDKYYMIRKHNWNKALIVGDNLQNVAITGQGIIDGSHVEDPDGEEKMRGPHAIFLSRTSGISISGISIVKASNYAFMSYDIENVVFSDLEMEEGWDGIHIRGGRHIQIRNCRFMTGDDAIAGGLWENMSISNCYLNSSCNGIRVIMPVTGLQINQCSFEGPGKYSHRTSRELMRRNMLSGIMIQPGGWFVSPGKIENVVITNCHFDNLDNPFHLTLSQGNEGDDILIKRIKGTRLNQAAASIESWHGGFFRNVRLIDISLEYTGNPDHRLKEIIPSKPATDYRLLPCWGFFVRNVSNITFENVKLTFTGDEARPAFYFDNTASIYMDGTEIQHSLAGEDKIVINSGTIQSKQ